MIVLIAMRNVIRNKKNSIIIMLLIAIITFLFFTGNTIIGQSGRGLYAAYTESLTGDMVLEKAGDVTISLFGANAPHLEDFFLIETLPVYHKLETIVQALPELESWTSQVSTGAHMRIFEKGRTVFLTGIAPQSYFPMFPGIVLEQGKMLAAGEYGIMLNRELAKEIEKETGKKLQPGTPVTLTTSGRTGFKIREIPLAGIYSYRNTNTILSNIVLVDAETARILAAIRTASADVALSDETRALLDDSAFSSLFDDEQAGAYHDVASASVSLEDSIQNMLQSDTEVQNKMQNAGGDWNFILVKLRAGTNIKKTIKQLNTELEPYGVIAVDWRTAAGISALFVLLLQVLYNTGIIIICIAGIIAIINILLIAVFKRTREIGTLRAMGAPDNYIRLLLITENCFLGFLGGLLGVTAGYVVFSIINALHININNDLLVNFLGVEELQISFFPEYAALSVCFSVVLTFLSLLFPIETACKIEPVIAVREG